MEKRRRKEETRSRQVELKMASDSEWLSDWM
jgi:hypothetical protein